MTEKGGKWIEWIHEQDGQSCCATCIALGGCYFLENKMPEQPVHPNCHCAKEAISYFEAESICERPKFDKYAFVFKEKDDKSLWFLEFGYDILDTDYMLQEYSQQAALKYVTGEYELAEPPNENGQKIKVAITVPDRVKGGLIEIISVWQVNRYGKIRLVTPIIEVRRI